MNNIVFLTGTYFDRPSANGICVQKIAMQLQAIGHDVDVICCESVKEEKKTPDNIHFISETQLVEHSRLQILCRKIKSACRLVWGVGTPNLSMEKVCDYIEALKEIASRKEIDLVIAVFFPLESVEAVFRYKKENPTVKFIVLEFDSVFDGVAQKNGRFPLYKYIHNRWQSKIYDSANAILLMKSHEEYWRKKFGDKYSDKLFIADIPVLSEKGIDTATHQKDRVSFLYAGLIEKKYRSPSYLLSVLQELDQRIDFSFGFFSKGDCENEIAEVAKSISKIKQKGYVPQEELDKAMMDTDILISIGNSVSRSVPSKIITYISYGKPIIHFSFQEKDVCKEYFDKYPLALVIDQSRPVDESCAKILEFIQNVKGKRLDFDTIRKTFYMNDPAYSAKIITENIF